MPSGANRIVKYFMTWLVLSGIIIIKSAIDFTVCLHFVLLSTLPVYLTSPLCKAKVRFPEEKK